MNAPGNETRRWTLDTLQAARAVTIRELQRQVRRSRARWLAMSADVPEDLETRARGEYQQAALAYLTELESYFEMTEAHRRQHHGNTETQQAGESAAR